MADDDFERTARNAAREAYVRTLSERYEYAMDGLRQEQAKERESLESKVREAQSNLGEAELGHRKAMQQLQDQLAREKRIFDAQLDEAGKGLRYQTELASNLGDVKSIGPLTAVNRSRNVSTSNGRATRSHESRPSSDSSALLVQSEAAEFSYSRDAMTRHQGLSLKAILRGFQYLEVSFPFRRPVNAKALDIPTYETIIEHPMDLLTMGIKLQDGQYHSVNDFTNDFELIVANCRKFNGDAHPVTEAALSMQMQSHGKMQSRENAHLRIPVTAPKILSSSGLATRVQPKRGAEQPQEGRTPVPAKRRRGQLNQRSAK